MTLFRWVYLIKVYCLFNLNTQNIQDIHTGVLSAEVHPRLPKGFGILERTYIR